jgi:hypothetical protein
MNYVLGVLESSVLVQLINKERVPQRTLFFFIVFFTPNFTVQQLAFRMHFGPNNKRGDSTDPRL